MDDFLLFVDSIPITKKYSLLCNVLELSREAG